MREFAFKTVLVIGLPFIVIMTIIRRTWDEVKSIPLYIRCDIGEEWEYLVRMMRMSKKETADYLDEQLCIIKAKKHFEKQGEQE